ncbi:putative RNA-directed DNA polymerase from transposon BS [Merluccius polli]|uniref:RNA-directed DNA polymerase from transposon BS n=1 Tax=Merluccius polli TaxID=89951 RepID=A0AA47P513_MERPO|nr:putative RNA-directed DNA polymerase from transposon BS [Merluccius polli]
MKFMERLVLAHLRPLVCSSQDPLQFAYQPHVGVDDAIIYLLQKAYSSLDCPNTSVRVMFFDFSSAFNTIQPRLLKAKLENMQVGAPLVTWVDDYLTGRPQFVRLKNCVSDCLISNIGAPQGTVLSPFLFTTYTADFQYCTEMCHLQKFSDDTAIVGCVEGGREAEYRDLVDRFVKWCGENHLQLNVAKTREMVVDFRRNKTLPSPVSIGGTDVDMVDKYKYLAVTLDNKLDWYDNTEAIYKKGLSQLYFLRRLRSFNVCHRMLQMFYQSVVASTIFFAVVSWGAGIRTKDANRLNKLIKKAESVVGSQLVTVEEVVEERMLAKLLPTMATPSILHWTS